MNRLNGFLLLFLFSFLAACATIHVAGEVAPGREALLQENPKLALAHFKQAAEMDPDFYLNWSLLQQGVWTYVGRAYYGTGEMGEARSALEKATSRYSWDNMAKLYLGLVLLRENERARGLKEVDAGLLGLYDWIDYVNAKELPDGAYWDPGGFIKKRIDQTRGLIQAKDVAVPEVIAAGEYIGLRMEKEMDFARQQQMRAYRGQSAHDRN
jgi:tetratricopeptide (TPR) repeat protein